MKTKYFSFQALVGFTGLQLENPDHRHELPRILNFLVIAKFSNTYQTPTNICNQQCLLQVRNCQGWACRALSVTKLSL
jgi:hypothetical protein